MRRASSGTHSDKSGFASVKSAEGCQVDGLPHSTPELAPASSTALPSVHEVGIHWAGLLPHGRGMPCFIAYGGSNKRQLSRLCWNQSVQATCASEPCEI